MILAGCMVATLAVLHQARPNTAPKGRTPAHGGVREAERSVDRPIVLAARNHLPPLRRDPFAPRVEPTPQPAVPPQQVQGPPAGPQAPPVPYRFVGKVTYGDNTRVALTAGDRIHLVVEGETIDGGYVVRQITSDKVTLVYTPLGIDQELALLTEASVPATPVPATAATAAPVQAAVQPPGQDPGQIAAQVPAPVAKVPASVAKVPAAVAQVPAPVAQVPSWSAQVAAPPPNQQRPAERR